MAMQDLLTNNTEDTTTSPMEDMVKTMILNHSEDDASGNTPFQPQIQGQSPTTTPDKVAGMLSLIGPATQQQPIRTAQVGPFGAHLLVKDPNQGMQNFNNAISGAANMYLMGRQIEKKGQFQQQVNSLMNMNVTPQDKAQGLISLKAQFGGEDFGIGVDDLIKQMDATAKIPKPVNAEANIAQYVRMGVLPSDQAFQLAQAKGLTEQSNPQLFSLIKQKAQQEVENHANDTSQQNGLADKWQVDPNTLKLVPQKADINEERQNRLLKQAQGAVISVRGDTSLQKVEAQRDASISAYNTIQNVQSQNRLPTQMEYYDLIGQLWKARTGTAPTNEVMQHLDAKVFHGDLSRVYQYFTGQKSSMSSPDLMNNLKDFTQQTGMQMDALHDRYMQNRLIKPKGMDNDTWQNIVEAGRGMSFKEATTNPPLTNQQPQAQGQQQAQQQSQYVRMGTLPDGRRVGQKADGTTEVVNAQ